MEFATGIVPLLRTLAMSALCAGVSSMSQAGAAPPPDEIIIRYHSAKRLHDHGKVARRLGKHRDVVILDGVSAAESADAKSARLWRTIGRIRRDSNVLYAEPNFRGHFEQTLPGVPDDPSYSSQWWLPAVGDREMWALGRGAGVIVAVIDSGADLTHPDLMPNLLPNGYNFGDGNDTPQDVLGHGTKVAGIIAARQNNQIGVSGLAPEAKILPLKVNAGGQQSFSSDQLASAVAYAVAQGAAIINLSLTVDQQTQTVRDAIQAALDQGVIVVAAAGNSGGAVDFPATMPGVIAVAATDQSRHLAGSSNSGPEILLAAPGVNVLTTALGGGVAASNPGGTSFAAPAVAATIADMLSINPTLPVEVIARQLRQNASAIAGGQYTFGTLDAGATGNSLVPRLQLSKQQFSAAESVAINFSVPPTGTAVDVYVAVETPSGSFSLCPDGNWAPVVANGFQPVASGYRNQQNASGALFGSVGGGGTGSTAAFPPIALGGFPAGTYTWAIAIRTISSGHLVGGVMTSTMRLQ